MNKKVIDGKAIYLEICEELKKTVFAFRNKDVVPLLTVILVGNDPASAVYVRNKTQACENIGILSNTIFFRDDIQESELINTIESLNQNDKVHGILVQSPLPKHINTSRIYTSISPQKDVDCFHPYNIGMLMLGTPIFIPCTPAGIMELLKRSDVSTEGKHIVIIGRSNIVGKPLAMLMMQKEGGNATVTVCHTGSNDIISFTKKADILITAMGKPEFITGDMVKKEAVVIDVGVNRVPDNNKKSGYRIVGDVNFNSVENIVYKITPVPGGVGPMTIAMLLKNTLKATEIQVVKKS